MSGTDSFPFSSLPEELQCHIFEDAVDEDPEGAWDLALVSRSAAAWVQPRIFREVVLSLNPHSRQPGQILLRDLQTKPDQFLAAHLKRLCMPYESISLEAAVQLLTPCIGVVDLAMWIEFGTWGELPDGQAEEDEKERLM
ncbi:hypothetical protein BKA70DRAFT_1245309 [Coprinopsis sp. MPI-PUGE-AT-0042]|nr:hypothetical protein BKA70DRAFT_1245309 [Coprinopsis sp. MPI-PUGE-AT-0042]